ncbi:MAG: NfeD family protein, partial [Gaiella sp.]
ADSLPALLDEIDGRVVQPKGLTLQTADAELVPVEMSFWKQALDLLIDPNIITLMLSLGIVGLLVELWNPGLIFPGTVGAISLLVGLYGLQVLPVSVAGALLLLLAVAFWIAEAFVPSHGALTVAGGVMFVIGALMLFDPAGDAYQVSVWTALAIAGALMLLLGVALTRIVKARRNPVAVGVSTLVGEEAVVREADWVTLAGERWRARSVDGSRLQPGEHVTIEAVDTELGLLVRPRTPTERPNP